MFRRDIMAILIAGLAVGGLFGYHVIQGTDVPIWQALAVAVVNILAALKLFLTGRKGRRSHPDSLPGKK
jgi:uncharacterized membrane protein YfcA